MAYTTEAIIRRRSVFKNSTNITSTYITNKIADADSLIDGVIGGVYTLPLSETPNLVRDISTTLTIFKMIEDQNLNLEVSSGVNVTQMIEDAMNILEMIRTRKMKLFDSAGAELAVADLIKPDFYPTQTSSDAGDTSARFSINKVF